jgi:hypothetical protein
LVQQFRSIELPDEGKCSIHRRCEGGQQAFGKCHYVNVKINLVSSQDIATHISLDSPSPS